MRRVGLRRISPSCRSYSKVLSLPPRSREEFRHANDDENHLSGLLNWCGRDWHTHTSANAQYYPPPGYGYGDGDGYGYGYRYGYSYHRRTWNGCLSGWTVQGGNCAPYKGPGGGGWNTPNGCPPGYTVQGGNCAPYRYGR